MSIIDAIPVNIFIVGVTLLTGIVLFFILTKIPEEENKGNRK